MYQSQRKKNSPRPDPKKLSTQKTDIKRYREIKQQQKNVRPNYLTNKTSIKKGK